MEHTYKSFQQKELSILGEICQGRKSRLDFKILPFEDKNTFITFNYAESCRFSKLCSINLPDETRDPAIFFSDLSKNQHAMEKLKNNSPEDYKKLKVTLGMIAAQTCSEARKSDWVLITARSEINGQLYALSHYVTWMYRTFKDDPVEHMKERSIISILHQDTFLIKPMLNDIAKVFKEAIEWNRENIKDLKERVALLQYELAHAMPFHRGSAAISEWIEMAIYEFHGYKLTYNPKKMVNLEALTSMLPDFVKNYDSLVTLEELQIQS